jgi:hypothetical protein
MTSHARLTVTMALGLLLVAGCQPMTQDRNTSDVPNWRNGVGVSPNCAGQATEVLRTKFSMNDDNHPDWFFVLRCPDASAKGRGDQLEVLDGDTDPSQPRRLGDQKHPLIHPDQKIVIAAGGCLMFAPGKVFVADRRLASGAGWHVVKIGTWGKTGVAMKPPGNASVPCDQAR